MRRLSSAGDMPVKRRIIAEKTHIIIPRATSVFFMEVFFTESKLTELLSRDKESRKFFASLSPELRKMLMKQDIGNFQALERAVGECGEHTFAAAELSHGQAASPNESTGAVPRGADLSTEEWRRFNSVQGFGGKA